MQYVVCNLLQKMPEQFIKNFDIILDKGTLDALLPEDKHNTIK